MVNVRKPAPVTVICFWQVHFQLPTGARYSQSNQISFSLRPSGHLCHSTVPKIPPPHEHKVTNLSVLTPGLSPRGPHGQVGRFWRNPWLWDKQTFRFMDNLSAQNNSSSSHELDFTKNAIWYTKTFLAWRQNVCLKGRASTSDSVLYVSNLRPHPL